MFLLGFTGLRKNKIHIRNLPACVYGIVENPKMILLGFTGLGKNRYPQNTALFLEDLHENTKRLLFDIRNGDKWQHVIFCLYVL